MDDIDIDKDGETVTIPGWELWFTASRSGGPGGQHANTTASRVTLHWNIEDTQALEENRRRRLKNRLSSHINSDGVLQISAADERSQHRNRKIARERLAELVEEGLEKPKRRIPTRPSRSSKRRRLKNKRHRGRIKKLRQSPEVPRDY